MIQLIQLKNLTHSPSNVRKVKPSDSSFKSLCASIKSKGLLHNLVVVEADKSHHVIDGNRRLDALRTVYDEGKAVPCIVLPADDPEAGLHANMMRENMHPIDECDVILAMCADGAETYDSVALRFGQTDKWVKQRVSLSELSDLAKEKFRSHDINLSVAQALTLGTKERQNDYLSSTEHYSPQAAKAFMVTAKVPVKNAFFDIEPYKSELGIESDLFGEDEYITNVSRFEELQDDYIMAQKAEYEAQDYYDVVLLRDQYHWDAPELSRCQLVWDESRFDREQLIVVLTYNTVKYSLDKQLMVLYEFEEQAQVEEAIEEAEEEITPLTFSKPQKQLVDSYYGDYILRQLWESEEIDVQKLMKAVLCHRKLGYTYSTVNRVGSVYSDDQSLFPSDYDVSDIAPYDFDKLIQVHVDLAWKDFDDNETTPLSYCYNLPDSDLDKLFIACCLKGLGKSDFRAEAFLPYSKAVDTKEGWFKPSEEWVNKWKVNQLSMMEEFLFGNAKSNSKYARVMAIVEALDSRPKFDPYGNWPQ